MNTRGLPYELQKHIEKGISSTYLSTISSLSAFFVTAQGCYLHANHVWQNRFSYSKREISSTLVKQL